MVLGSFRPLKHTLKDFCEALCCLFFYTVVYKEYVLTSDEVF